MTTPEEIAARREAWDDDPDNVRPDYPASAGLLEATKDAATLRRERDELRAEVARLTHLLGSHADGHRCTCTMVDPGVYHGYNMHPPEWEQDPWCPTHPDVDYIRQQYEALRAENAMLRECRDTEQRALAAALPIVAAATDGPRMWVEPDAYGEPTIWTDDEGGIPQPVIAKSDLCVGSRHLWPVVVARLTAGSAT